MRKERLVFGVAAFLMVAQIVFGTSVQATPSEQSELTQRTLNYQRTLTLPAGTDLSQRALVAVSLAAGELQSTDPLAFNDAYHAAVSVDNYRPLSDTSWSWVTDDWVYVTRTTYTYDGQVFPIEVLTQQWDGNQWNNQVRISTEYDGSGKQTVVTTEYWVGTLWEHAVRSLFDYDGSGNPWVTTTQTWDTLGQAWVNLSRVTMTYSGGLVDSSISEIWDNGSWRLTGKITYEYNANNRVSVVTSQIDFGSGLQNSSRMTHSYDGNNNLTESLSEVWDNGSWKSSSKLEYSYDGMNREILEVSSSYFLGVWQVFSTDTTKYSGDRISETVHVDVLFGPQVYRSLHEYDDNAMTETVINQQWDPNLQAGPTADWVNIGREMTVYEEYATAVQIETEPWSPRYELAQNFPNPFNPTTLIHYSLHRTADVNIAVYNILGQHVATLENGTQEPGVYETRWNGTDHAGRAVPSGVYFYRLKANGQVDTRKMLLLK
ncbi:MAG: hypothetical protein Kow0074_14010 [Candidatus Zixiibacteriota bacterium]